MEGGRRDRRVVSEAKLMLRGLSKGEKRESGFVRTLQGIR